MSKQDTKQFAKSCIFVADDSTRLHLRWVFWEERREDGARHQGAHQWRLHAELPQPVLRSGQTSIPIILRALHPLYFKSKWHEAKRKPASLKTLASNVFCVCNTLTHVIHWCNTYNHRHCHNKRWQTLLTLRGMRYPTVKTRLSGTWVGATRGTWWSWTSTPPGPSSLASFSPPLPVSRWWKTYHIEDVLKLSNKNTS